MSIYLLVQRVTSEKSWSFQSCLKVMVALAWQLSHWLYPKTFCLTIVCILDISIKWLCSNIVKYKMNFPDIIIIKQMLCLGISHHWGDLRHKSLVEGIGPQTKLLPRNKTPLIDNKTPLTANWDRSWSCVWEIKHQTRSQQAVSDTEAQTYMCISI